MTPECNLPQGFSARAAIRVEATVRSIADGIRQLMEVAPVEREAIGKRGLALVQQEFLWPRVAEKILAIQEWVAGRRPRPETVLAT
jgi:poly(glycerol-phosphate) alpha-glucosyltransferase